MWLDFSIFCFRSHRRHYNTRSSGGGSGSVGAGRLEPDMGLPKLSSASLRKSDKVLKLPQLVCDYTTEKKDASRRQARVYRRRRGSALAIPANAGAAATRSDKQQARIGNEAVNGCVRAA